MLETFLGGRSLSEAALTISVFAPAENEVNVVAYQEHIYAYGFHLLWTLLLTPLAAVVTSRVFLPVLYELRAASAFQFLRLRFDDKVGITSCVVYFISQTLRARGVYSAAVGISASCQEPTAEVLGSTERQGQEGGVLKCGQSLRMAVTGGFIVVSFFLFGDVAALFLIYWYRDCDLVLSGAINSYDQIVPYFVKERLAEVTMLRGLFLAGLLGASTSTVSSIVNSHAAIFYVDVVSPYVTMTERSTVTVTRLLAVASGIIMTLFAIAVPYMGTAARLFLSLYSSASGPFIGLILLGVSSPWVNAKGAAWAGLLVCALQLWHAVGRGLSAVPPPPVVTGTLERCPPQINGTGAVAGATTYPIDPLLSGSPYVFPLYRLSFFWVSSIGTVLTVILGTALSLATEIEIKDTQ
ncbi:putative sodium-dependent multivitamin transporter [Amblyomma americanum]